MNGILSCYAQQKRGTKNLTLLYHLMKATYNGKEYHYKKFSSHSFTKQFLNHDFPIGIQANDMQLSESHWMLGNTITWIINYVNINGGWNIIGWYSRGLINDRTLTGLMGNNSNNNSGPNQNNQNNSEVQVDGGDLTYHFCKVIMKFDVNDISSST